MADFRKWLYAFAGVTLLAGLSAPASAQSNLMQCTGSANNPLIRAEEYTALAGDVFITCTGGIPTTAGTSVPKATITVFVTNTAITSKLTQTTDDPAWNEALLIMDEAGTSTSTVGLENCGSASAPFQTAPNDLTCNITSANGDGTGDYDGTPTRPNVFQARQVDNSFGQAIQFIGVPIDPPGPPVLGTGPAPGGNGCNAGVTCVPSRTMRLTNLRVNAVSFNVYNLGNSFSFTTINTTVTFNGTNFGGNQIFTVPNGTVRIGLVATQSTATNDLLTGPATFLQCNAQPGFTTNSILLTEGFPTAFKVRNFAQILTNGNPPGLPGQLYTWNGGTSLVSPDINQNVPNALYNTETGINFDPALAVPTPTNPPAGTGSNGAAPTTGTAFNGSTGIATAGEVSQGTRFAIRFSGIPIGSNPSVPLTVDLETGAASNDTDTGVIVLVCGTDSHGYGGSAAACANSGIGNTSPITLDANGNGLVVYEVAFADPNALEFANVAVYVNPTVNLNATTPVGGTPQVGVTGSANASFAPFYATSTPGVGAAQILSSSFPIPRFVDNPLPTPPVSLFTYGKCACDMLFPWVVGNSAINTSIVVANTSLDPCAGSSPVCAAGFTAIPQPGKVTFWFFGTADFNFNPATFGTAVGPDTVIASQQSVSVPAGSYIAFVISPSAAVAGGQTAGNGLKAIAGPFAGYVIAQSEFQYCHGIASLSGVGLTPQTYLGLVLDKAGVPGFGGGSTPIVNGGAKQLLRTNQAFADELEN
jgi:hypothetical protein